MIYKQQILSIYMCKCLKFVITSCPQIKVTVFSFFITSINKDLGTGIA